MNIVILMVAILTFSLNLFEQLHNEYPSKEETAYYKNRKFKAFKPLKKSEIQNYQSEYFKIEHIDKFRPYMDSLYLTPYQDSIYAIMFDLTNQDSIIFPEPEFIGGIEKSRILKYEKNGPIEAMIYTSGEFENRYFGESGIWIGYSDNSGRNWNYYYTGIVEKQPLYLKWYSGYPLILDKGKLQIEETLLRQLEPFMHPGPAPKYDVVKDGICVIFDLATIGKDTDNDGLTDIVENKLFTNKNNPDSDSDGIPDNLDLNPRKNLPKTECTIVYEAIINNQITWDSAGIGHFRNSKEPKHFVTDTTETVMIVTDNPDLLSVQPITTRIIFITDKEKGQFKNAFKTDLNDMVFSPLFKVDNRVDTYKLSVSFNTWGNKFLIRKTENEWIIELLSSWIS